VKGRHTAREGVFEAHIEGRVGVGGEGKSVLAVYVFGLVVVVAHRIANLGAPSRQPLQHSDISFHDSRC
jgi:hypothetical protein